MTYEELTLQYNNSVLVTFKGRGFFFFLGGTMLFFNPRAIETDLFLKSISSNGVRIGVLSRFCAHFARGYQFGKD